MADDDRPELAAFLRSRRERLSPQEVGLSVGNGRRRTPGLRREELAMLAGISVDYLVRLEQGRETNPSMSVVAALARALKLSYDERRHLVALAKLGAKEPYLCPQATTDAELDETIAALLERLEGSPAFVMNIPTEVLAWNHAYETLMAASGLFDLDPPHLLRYTFLSPQSRSFYGDWAAVAREQVGNLRAASAVCKEDPAVMDLVGELSVKSHDFAELWADHEVHEKNWGTKAFAHPDVGELQLRYQALLLPDNSGRSLISYLPADSASAGRLDELVLVERAPLRVVGGTTA